MPNLFAYLVLIIWPFIAIIFYKRFSALEATFWTIVGGFLLLPVSVAIDFSFIPPMNKETIVALSTLIGCRFIKKIKIKLLPPDKLARWLVILLLITQVFTVLNNQEPVNFIRGLSFYDAVSTIINQYLILIPFILGSQLIKTNEDQLLIFKLVVIAGLAYSLPILFEIRMSPQLHTWIYGFFPHSFIQQYRYDGFRPVVFLGHGLIVAMFVAIVLGTATVLMKQKIRILRLPPQLIVGYLVVLLVLCKSAGAFILGLFLFVAITWVPVSMLKRASLFLVAIFMLYPLLSIFDLFPHDQLLQFISSYDAERAESLAYRFNNEHLLLLHAKEKLITGWGVWGRNRLDGVATDGYWIIFLGQFGLVGFVSLFGLIALSIWKAIKASSLIENRDSRKLLLYYALIVAVMLIDQLPNASLSAWMLLIIGGALGRANKIKYEYIHRQKVAI